jgi:hypothetical protein
MVPDVRCAAGQEVSMHAWKKALAAIVFTGAAVCWLPTTLFAQDFEQE